MTPTSFSPEADKYIAYLRETHDRELKYFKGHLASQIEAMRKCKLENSDLRKKVKHLNAHIEQLSQQTVRMKIESFADLPRGMNG